MAKSKKSKVEVPYPRPQRIIAIDPAERTGVATYDGRSEGFVLEAAWEVQGTVKSAAGVLREFAKASAGEPMGMALERQFMKAKPKGGNSEGGVVVHGYGSLVYRRKIWHLLSAVFGISVTLIYPVSWQSKQLPKKANDEETTKERALKSCLKQFPDHELMWHTSDNARDAALLGRFFADLVEDSTV